MNKTDAMYSGDAPAKINLFLEVVDKRSDGFHNIDSVFAQIDLCDRLRLEKNDDGQIRLDVSGMPGIPDDKSNLVYRAIELFRKHAGVDAGFGVELEKRIPSGGGLGGGSSDAALALRLANESVGGRLSPEELQNVGAELGSDIPFFFYGGVAGGRGRGELVCPVEPVGAGIPVSVVLTGVHCDTAAAYRGLRLPGRGEAKRSEDFVAAYRTGNVEAMEQAAFNRFEETIFEAYPGLGGMCRELSGIVGRPVRLSGSGGSLWYFSRGDDADNGRLRAWTEAAGVAVRNVCIQPRPEV